MKIVYFSPIEYDDLKQRPQYIAEELSKKHDVWYIEPTISFLGALKYCNRKYKKRKYDISSTLHVVRLSGFFTLPLRYLGKDKKNLASLNEKEQLKRLIPDADIWWIGYEAWGRFLDSDSPKVIYDKMDDNVLMNKNPHIKLNLKYWEEVVLNRASAIFVTAKKFYNELSRTYSNVTLLPNAVDGSFLPSASKRQDVKTYGYIGTIGHWFDNEAIIKIAEANPDASIILVGPCLQEKIEMQNVKYIGRVPKSEVNKWISKFDICLYPFKQNELLETINPVKIYEYLYMNKPVIAVKSTETVQFLPYIHCYSTYDELEKLSKEDLLCPFTSDEKGELFAKDNTWKQRVNVINQVIDTLF